MALRDKIFTRQMFDKTSSCGVFPASGGMPADFSGTLEQALDLVKKEAKIDYWVGLWTCLQFFDELEVRRVAKDVLEKAVNEKSEPTAKAAISVLVKYLDGDLTKRELEQYHQNLKVLALVEKHKSEVTRSAVACLSPEPHKSVPLALLKLRTIAGPNFIDTVVRERLKGHP